MFIAVAITKSVPAPEERNKNHVSHVIHFAPTELVLISLAALYKHFIPTGFHSVGESC